MAKNSTSNSKESVGRYDFVGYAKYLVPLTFILVILGAIDVAIQGLNYGVDFRGGTEVQVHFATDPGQDKLIAEVKTSGYEDFSVQKFEGASEYTMRFEAVKGDNDDDSNKKLNLLITTVTDTIKSKLAEFNPDIRRIDTVGPQVGSELKRSGILATFYSLIIILVYIGLRFDFKYAPGAVICLVHDTILTLAVFSVTGREVNLQTMAAVLTLIGYSLNDTIIIFDRIREVEDLYPDDTMANVVNRSINEMLGRTLMTSGMTFFGCVTLYAFADGVIRDIAFTMGIGIIIGTFSSVYVAAPIMMAIDKYEKNKASLRLRTAKA